MWAKILKILSITLLATGMFCGAGGSVSADELWGCAIHREQKLFGRVYSREVRESGWAGEMPPGWDRIAGPDKPGKYYLDLGRLRPETAGGEVVFRATRWDFVNSAWQDGFTSEAIQNTLGALRETKGIRFVEDDDLAEAEKNFEKIDRGRIAEALDKKRLKIDFSISAKGAVAVRATGGALVKLLVENYGSTGRVSFRSAEGEGSGRVLRGCFVVSLQSTWRKDLDGDGLIDLQWNPISHIESSSFEVLKGFAVAGLEIYSR